MKGSEWIEKVRGLPRDEVMLAAVAAVEAGDYIEWPMQPVDAGDGITVAVAMDYFAIGERDDFVRVPLDGPTAQRVADILGFLLPTARIVDLTWKAADVKIAPQPMSGPSYPYDNSMMSVERFAEHSAWIDKSFRAEADFGKLFAGHKKDVVISNRLNEKPGRLAIYGWNRLNGNPIQGPNVSIRHIETYYDYSHGVRFVGRVARVRGVEVSLAELLVKESTAWRLSGEGPLLVLGYDEAVSPTDPSPPTTLPTLQRGSTGPDVKRWQRIVGETADGDFGPLTQAATRMLQRRHHLDPTGVVDVDTWDVGLQEEVDKRTPTPPAPVSDTESVLLNIDFVRARNFTPAKRGVAAIRHIVIHDMEAPEHPGTAESVAAWFAGPDAPQASAHYNVDGDSIVQSVQDCDVAWHAPGCNRSGLGIEHAGYARQTSAEWADAYSEAMLRLSALLVADLCATFEIPVEMVDWEGLIAGETGITSHAEVSKACVHAQKERLTSSPFYNHKRDRPKTNHYDPGKNFPWAHYFDLVRAAQT